MSEPSKTPIKKEKKQTTEMPDDDAIRRLFPKKVVEEVNKEIGHEVKKRTDSPNEK
jgi:hypothetical protein